MWFSYTVLQFAVSVCLVLWSQKFSTEAALVFLITGTVSLTAMVKYCLVLYDAKLIADNPILEVRPIHIYPVGQKQSDSPQTIVISTFGLLVGERVYSWGCKPGGARLMAAEIDRRMFHLVFGDGKNGMQAHILHGLDDMQVVAEVSERLWHETGVRLVMRDD